tara:strand:- start:4137 stop:4826 length:690 start_codon:yes stop_codon:yes gene_type:complete
MEITIFKEITTEGVISSIEENSKKYHEGFYADMNNAPERKLVKESAADINNMIKDLKAARIRITKENTARVNKEHDAIVERLVVANLPFTVLIDEYNIERKRVLDEEKRVIALKAAMIQKEDDHEMALLINKAFEIDKAEELRKQEEIRHNMKLDAEKQAAERQKQLSEKLEQDKINAENARLANVEHIKGINNQALSDLVGLGLTENNAKAVISAIAKRLISHITINY